MIILNIPDSLEYTFVLVCTVVASRACELVPRHSQTLSEAKQAPVSFKDSKKCYTSWTRLYLFIYFQTVSMKDVKRKETCDRLVFHKSSITAVSGNKLTLIKTA